jgi:YVTN family beta-propeller protein
MQTLLARLRKPALAGLLSGLLLLGAAWGGWVWLARLNVAPPDAAKPAVTVQMPHAEVAAQSTPKPSEDEQSPSGSLTRGDKLGGADSSSASAPQAATAAAASSGASTLAHSKLNRAKAPIFVLNSLDATISVMDPISYAEIKRIPTGKQPHHFYLTPDERSLIVANSVSDSLTLVDPMTAQVQRTITGIIDPYQLRFSPDMKWFVTAANRLNHIDIYRWQPQDTTEPLKLAARIPASKTPSHLSIDQQSRYAYVSLQESDELIAIDLATQKPLWRIPVGRMPADVYLTPDGKHLLLGMTGDEVVEVYDISQTATQAAKLIRRIKTGAGAHAFRSAGDGRHVFVSNRVANTVTKLDVIQLEAVESYPAPGGPDCMDVLADGKTLLLTSRWSRQLTVIDTGTKQISQQVAVGRSPHGVWTLNHASRL